MIDNASVCPYYDGRRSSFIIRCDDCKGGLFRRFRTTSTFRFYERFPRAALSCGINPLGWTRGMWERLAVLVRKRGWEAASHSMHHPSLTRIEPDAVRSELADSRDEILARLRQAGLELRGVPTFIFPFGDYGKRELDLLTECGYEIALTYKTHEKVIAIPNRERWLEWGYTLNAPEEIAADALWRAFESVHESQGVFSVTTHPPVVRPDKRLRNANIYGKSGTWARFLERVMPIEDVWFTTYGTLGAYEEARRGASVRALDGSSLEASFTPASSPFPPAPLTIACAVDRCPTAVLVNDRELPKRSSGSDVPEAGWRHAAGRLVASLSAPGRISLRFD